MAENLVHLSKGCLIVFLFNSNVPHTSSRVRVPLQHLWSLRHSGGSSVGEIQRECFHHMAPAVNSVAALPQDCTRLISVRASPAPAHWEFGNFVITNSLFSPPAGGSLGVPIAFENEYSNFSNTVWKTSGLVFLSQLTLPKAHMPSLGKHLQFQLQDSRLRGLCVTPVLPYSILPSRKYLERKSNCLETAEIN